MDPVLGNCDQPKPRMAQPEKAGGKSGGELARQCMINGDHGPHRWIEYNGRFSPARTRWCGGDHTEETP